MDQLVNCPLKSWQSLMGFTLMQWRAVYMILIGGGRKAANADMEWYSAAAKLRAASVI